MGLENGIFWNTGDESDTQGHISEDPVNRVEMMDKRQSRLDHILEKIPESEQIVKHSEGDFCIISWGSTQGPILDAVEMLINDGIDIGFIELKFSVMNVVKHQNSMDSGRGTFKLAEATIIELKV